jgi:hypothetical protein
MTTESGGTVIEARRVSGRDCAVLGKGRLELGYGIERRSRADILVLIDNDVVVTLGS